MAYIVRVDKPKDNPQKGTHGWQVRGSKARGYHSKFFSDGVHGGRQQALEAAREYRIQYEQEHPTEANRMQYPHGFRVGDPLINNKSGVTGVYRSQDIKTLRNGDVSVNYYWAAFCPIGPSGQRNKWSKTYHVNKYGEEEAKQLAIEFRKGWEEAALQGEEVLEEFFVREFYDKIDYPEPPEMVP